MTRNLKALGLALVAVLAMSALAAQGASAADPVPHEFHADGENTVVTGTNTNAHKFTVGTSGTVECNKVQTESTQTGTEVGAKTFATDTITVTPHYSECTFGGNPAEVHFNHCAYVFDSDTTEGNTTIKEAQHANVEIECANNPETGKPTEIEITTSVCTLTVGPQLIKHAVRYENDPANKNAVNVITTAHNVIVRNTNDKAGCVLLPKEALGKYTGNTTGVCFKDEGSALTGTEKTTPTEKTVEGAETECKVSNL